MINLAIRYGLDADGYTIYFSDINELLTYYIYTTRGRYLTRWYSDYDAKEINHKEIFNICIEYLKQNNLVIDNKN